MNTKTEYAICLDSSNRDTVRFPEPNDITIDLKERCSVQAIVLGSFEFPYSQYLIEDDWCDFEFDTGISVRNDEERKLKLGAFEACVLPLPFLEIRFIGGDLFEGVSAHGLGPQSLSLFGRHARVILINRDTREPREHRITEIVSTTQLRVDADMTEYYENGLLVVQWQTIIRFARQKI